MYFLFNIAKRFILGFIVGLAAMSTRVTLMALVTVGGALLLLTLWPYRDRERCILELFSGLQRGMTGIIVFGGYFDLFDANDSAAVAMITSLLTMASSFVLVCWCYFIVAQVPLVASQICWGQVLFGNHSFRTFSCRSYRQSSQDLHGCLCICAGG